MKRSLCMKAAMLCVLCFTSEISAMLVQINEGYGRFVQTLSGVSNDFTKAIATESIRGKLTGLTDYYSQLQNESLHKKTMYMRLINDSSVPLEKKELEDALTILKLNERKAMNEMIALFLMINREKADADYVNDAILMLQGKMVSDEVIEKMRKTASSK